MLSDVERRMLKKRSRLIVLDLNAVMEGARLDALRRKVEYDGFRVLIEGLSMEELATDPPTSARSMSIFFSLLRPIRDSILVKRETPFFLYEECATCKPVVNLVSPQLTRVIRDVIASKASSAKSILEAFPGLIEAAEKRAAGEKIDSAKRIILGGMSGLLENVKPEYVQAVVADRGSLLALHMGSFMIRSSLYFANGFESLPLEGAREFMLHSFASRLSPALFAVPMWYAARGRKGSPDGRREENDMYDVFYAILGSLTGGLESYDERSVQPFILRALHAGRQWVEAVAPHVLAEDIVEVAGSLDEQGLIGQGWRDMADVGGEMAMEETRIADIWQ